MLKLLNHNIILPKYLEIVKKNKPAEKIAVGSEGAAEGGCGGNSAAPKPKRSPAALLVQSRVPQKSFLFLLEEKEIARQIKKCEENFFAEQRAKRAAAGRSVSFVQKRFGFRQTNAPVSNFQEFCPTDSAARGARLASQSKIRFCFRRKIPEFAPITI